jgi:hypothetical protein
VAVGDGLFVDIRNVSLCVVQLNSNLKSSLGFGFAPMMVIEVNGFRVPKESHGAVTYQNPIDITILHQPEIRMTLAHEKR